MKFTPEVILLSTHTKTSHILRERLVWFLVPDFYPLLSFTGLRRKLLAFDAGFAGDVVKDYYNTNRSSLV